MKKRILLMTSLILIAFGSIWVLQGVNILPGSFMTGHWQWAAIGSAMIVSGIALVVRGYT